MTTTPPPPLWGVELGRFRASTYIAVLHLTWGPPRPPKAVKADRQRMLPDAGASSDAVDEPKGLGP